MRPAIDVLVLILTLAAVAGSVPAGAQNLQPGRTDAPAIDDAQDAQKVRLQPPGELPHPSWLAINRTHGLTSRFDRTGVRVESLRPGAPGSPDAATASPEDDAAPAGVTFRFVGVGRGETVRVFDAVDAEVDGHRVRYRRDGITEWYVNDDAGLEQGFLLLAPPEGLSSARTPRRAPGARRALRPAPSVDESRDRMPARTDAEPAFVVLAIDGGLLPALSPDGQAIDFARQQGGLSVLSYTKLKVTDATGRELTSWMELFDDASTHGIRLLFDDAEATYPVTVDPLLTSSAWSVEGNVTGARLGWSVAGAGDLNGDQFDDVVVGSPDMPVDLDSDGTVDCGPGTGNTECSVGVVTAYHGSLTGLSTTPAWTMAGDQAGARFGHVVSGAGDVNDDGFADVLVGQPEYDGSAGADEGRALLYLGSASGLAGAAAWTVEGGQAGAHFGWSVNAAGDVNGDDFGDWIVGAPDHDGPAGVDEGKAYAYHGSGGALSQAAAWTDGGDEAGARFGYAVAGAGNVNGAEFDDVIVGAPYADNPGGSNDDEGQARLYLGTTAFAGLAPSPVWSAFGEEADAHFGWSVSTAGDTNGDGRDEWAVGAPDDGANQEGRAYVYLGANPLPPTTAAAWDAFGGGSARFGAALAPAGDIDLDGRPDLFVGAAGWRGPVGTSNGSRFGRARLFYSPSSATRDWAWETAGVQPQELLGHSVAAAGDVNRDGVPDVIVGAPQFHKGQLLEGRALVFHGARGVNASTLADRLGIPILDGSPATEVQSPRGTVLDARDGADAAWFGPLPGSILISTGRAADGGLGDSDRGLAGPFALPDGLPDVTTFEFTALVPSGRQTLCFGSQFITSEVPTNTDTARFCVNRSGGTCAPNHDLAALAYRAVNPGIQNCIDVRGRTQVFLKFEVADGDSDNNGSDDGAQDSALLLSRFYFSALAMPPDVLAETVNGYFNNPAPADVSRTAGVSTASRDLILEPSISTPFALTMGYSSISTHDGVLGSKWRHSFEATARNFPDGSDGGDFPDTVLVQVGGTTYFTETDTCSVSGIACSTNQDCPPTEQCQSTPGGGTYRPRHGQDSGSIVVTDVSGDKTVTYTSSDRFAYEFTQPSGTCEFGTNEGDPCDSDTDCLGVGTCDTDATMLLTKVTDVNGHEVSLAYDANDRLLSVTSTGGQCYGFAYDGQDRLVAASVGCPVSAGLRQATLTYDAAGMLASSTDVSGVRHDYTYADDGSLARATTGNGTLILENEFESFEGLGLEQNGFRLVLQKDAREADPGRRIVYEEEALIDVDRLGRESTRAFDVKGRLASVIDPTGVREEFVYDRQNRVLETRRQLPSESSMRVTSSAVYDLRGNPVVQTEFPGSCIGGDNPGASCLSDSDCPESTCGLRAAASYGRDDALQSSTDAAGHTWSFDYDLNGNLVSERDPLGHTVRHTYELVSGQKVNPEPASSTNTRGFRSTCEYDAVTGNLTSATGPLGNRVVHAYDARGRQISTTDPYGVANPGTGHTSCITYLESDRIASRGFLCSDDCVTCQLEWSYTYDAEGRLLSRTLPSGAVYANAYNASGYVAEEIDPLGKTASFDYDVADRLTGSSVTSPAEAAGGAGTLPPQFTEYTYDVGDRLTAVRALESDGGVLIAEVLNAYDERGNLVCLTNPNGDVVRIEHDLLGRIVRSGPASDCQNPIYAPQELTYNPKGLLSSLTNARGSEIAYEYDAGGRLRETSFEGSSISNELDANGNKIRSDLDGAAITRTFDPLDRIVSRTDEYGNTVGYVFDEAGNIAELHYPSGVSVAYTYDGMQRMTSVTDWDSRTTSYSYDTSGNLETITLPGGAVVTFSYDAAGRLTGIDDPGVGYQAALTRNTAGRTIAADETLPLDPEPGLLYPAADEIFAYGDRNLLSSRGAFDADGNMISASIDGTSTDMTYNAVNQLLSVTRAGAGTDSYRYDADGLRIEAERGGTVRRFVYDVTASSPRVLEERDASGTVVARYVHGLGLISRDDPAVPASFRVYHFDQRGSTIALADIGGSTTDSYAYDPFGRLVASTGATENSFLYNGRDGVVDDGNGLYYMRSRFYAPELMRFVQQDLVFPGVVTDTQTLNRYAFVLGNPIDQIDPNGDAVLTTIAIVVGVAVVAAVAGAVIFTAMECLPGSNAGQATVDFVSGEETQLQLGCTAAEAGGAAVEGAIVGASLAVAGQLAAAPIPGARSIAYGVTIAGGAVGGAAGGATEEFIETRGVENNFGPFEDQSEEEVPFNARSVGHRAALGAITSAFRIPGAKGASKGAAKGATKGSAKAGAKKASKKALAKSAFKSLAKKAAKKGAKAAAKKATLYVFNRLVTEPEEELGTTTFTPVSPVPPRVAPTGAPGIAATNGFAADVLSPLIFPIPGVVRTTTCGCTCEVWK